jgi:hypothetical protein
MATKDTTLKKANQLEEYTPDNVRELLKCVQDPIYFIENYCQIITGSGALQKFELYDYQKDVINMYNSNRFSISKQGRQSGKSQTSAAFLLWWGCFHENQTILIASNVFSGAIEILDRIKQMYAELPSFIKPGVANDKWNISQCAFDNHSRYIASTTTPNASRGKSPQILYLDEFAFVPNNFAEAFYTAIMPALAATQGKCIITSTTNGSDNIFCNLYTGAESGLNGFAHYFVPWNAPPGRDDAFKEAEISRIGDLRFRQEFASEFLSADPLLFSSIFVENYATPLLPSLDANGICWFDDINKNDTIIISCDPSCATGNDFTVIIGYKFPQLEQLFEVRTNTTSTSVIYNLLKYIIKFSNSKRAQSIYWSFENNSLGESLIALYESDENPPEDGILISQHGKKRLGFTTGKEKARYCMDFKNLFESGKLKVKSKNTITEMKHYIRRNGSYAARNGSTDDTLAAHLIMIRILGELVTFEDSAYSLLYDGADEFLNEFDDNDDYDVPMILTSNSNIRSYNNPWEKEDDEYKSEKEWLDAYYDNPNLYNITI